MQKNLILVKFDVAQSLTQLYFTKDAKCDILAENTLYVGNKLIIICIEQNIQN